MTIVNNLLRHLSNLPGWTSKRKFLILESDDWGSIRMPSKESYGKLVDSGILNSFDENSVYNLYDSLATSDDLSLLYEALNSFIDSRGNTAVFTPIVIPANPDFQKIRESGFEKYFYEPFTDTLKRYKNCENSFELWHEGIERNLFRPQFHGREHLNVLAWLNALKNKHVRIRGAFDEEMWGISTQDDPEIKLELQAAFDFRNIEELNYQKQVIKEGLILFEEIFSYRATYFVPPNGPYNFKLNKVCHENGIEYLSIPKVHNEPIGDGKSRKKFSWIGKRTNEGMISITRNCFFEPGVRDRDWVDRCLKEIEIAFRWNKPAIISTHRVNYIGAIDGKNGENGREQLQRLLKTIVKKWPDIEFITSDELGKIISQKSNA